MSGGFSSSDSMATRSKGELGVDSAAMLCGLE